MFDCPVHAVIDIGVYKHVYAVLVFFEHIVGAAANDDARAFFGEFADNLRLRDKHFVV